jgi:predicted ATP-dependent serine protease
MDKLQEGDSVILVVSETIHQPLCEIVEIDKSRCVVIDSLDKVHFVDLSSCKKACDKCQGSGTFSVKKEIEKNVFGDNIIDAEETECPKCDGKRYL